MSLKSACTFSIHSGYSPSFISGDGLRFTSGDGSRFISGDSPRITSGYNPRFISGNNLRSNLLTSMHENSDSGPSSQISDCSKKNLSPNELNESYCFVNGKVM